MAKSKKARSKRQRSHAKKRCFERYGVRINSKDLRAINAKIRTGLGCTHIYKKNKDIDEYLVLWEGVIFRVYYSNLSKQIVTFIPFHRDHEYIKDR
jgi:hypothetical protein